MIQLYALWRFTLVTCCSNCDAYRDTDLITEKEWSCVDPQCGKIYDREEMENRLVQMVREKERMYQIQDLVCNRCNQVKAAHLTEQCEYSESGLEFLKRIEIFLDIAKCQKFRMFTRLYLLDFISHNTIQERIKLVFT